MPSVVYSHHGREQMANRQITGEEVVYVVNNPQIKAAGKQAGRQVIRGRTQSGRYLKLVVSWPPDAAGYVTVITAAEIS